MEPKAESGDPTVTKGDAYPLCLESFKHHSTIFFALLTIYITVNIALLAVFAREKPQQVASEKPQQVASEKPQQEWVLPVAKWAGVFTSFVFLLILESCMRNTYYFRKRLFDLEVEGKPPRNYELYSELYPGLRDNWQVGLAWWFSHGGLGVWLWRTLFIAVFVLWVMPTHWLVAASSLLQKYLW